MANTSWRMEQHDDCNAASGVVGRVEVELDMLGSRILEIDVARGSGYGREQVRTYIPVEVIVTMMRHAGYIIQSPEEAAAVRGDDSCGQNI
jgi:hypothetical protein